ncbi:hypothetical protein YTPLAS18_10060 [Nitrospira sp.]|nr:hypothetical protein YTPLAS18_10060 [Nitrospira sp.]
MQNHKVVGLVTGLEVDDRLTTEHAVIAAGIKFYVEGFGVSPRPRQAAKVKVPSPPPPVVPVPLVAPVVPAPASATEIHEVKSKDGAPMVLVPTGEFWMGSPEGQGDDDEHPRHKVFLDAFYIDKYETSVSRYAKFMEATGQQSLPGYWDHLRLEKRGNLPVVGVDWHHAEAYCRWVGKRLPTEAEWEKTARGTDGRTYPWGNEEPTPTRANFGRKSIKNVYDEGLRSVDSLEAGRSRYGVHHLAGNVWEWVADWYERGYYRHSPERNPRGPSGGQYRVLRGGSWDSEPGLVRSVNRNRDGSMNRGDNVGFRCALDVPR